MRSSSKKIKFLIGVIVLILIIFFLNFFSSGVRSFFYSLSSPFQKVLWKAGGMTSNFFETALKIKGIKQERDNLRLENKELLNKIIFLESLKNENETLRRALEIELPKEFKLELSQIISKDISQDFILIDKGSNSGVAKNMPVITQEKVLVGKISEVYNNFSKIMLISNKESSFDVKIKNQENEISGILKGKGGLNSYIDLIPRDRDISPGNIVVSSQLGGVFPANLLIGEIIKVRKNDVESIQQADIKSAFDLSEKKYLFIITQY